MGLSLRPQTGPQLSQLGGVTSLAAAGESVHAVQEVPGKCCSPCWSSEVKGGAGSFSKVTAILGRLLHNAVLLDSSENSGSFQPAPQAWTK